MKLAALAFASYRLTRFIVDDSLIDYQRARVQAWAASGGPLRAKLNDLIECPYCTGVWASALVYALSARRRPLREHAVSLAAVAGGQALLSVYGQLGDDAITFIGKLDEEAKRRLMRRFP